MNVIFFETNQSNLLPLCYTRPVALLRVGILTILEKWNLRMPADYSFNTEEYLREKFSFHIDKDNLLLSSHVCPTDELVTEILKLKTGEGIINKGMPVACRVNKNDAASYPESLNNIKWQNFEKELDILCYSWEIPSLSERQFSIDFKLITKNKQSEVLDETNRWCGNKIFIEKGAKVKFATINASTGPVYIGKNSEIMEGSLIRGPFALCEHATLNMGTKVYGPVTVGPYSKVGGEISNSVIIGYSNKAHDGFLGHSVIGEWCNLGAGTNISNLKNNYEKVKVWNYPLNKFIGTGLQFCGTIMGDFSRTGIGTTINTGTVIGVGCNLYGAGFPRQFIPSFSIGGAHGYEVHTLKAVFDLSSKAMMRRNCIFTEHDQRILTVVYDRTAQYRRFK